MSTKSEIVWPAGREDRPLDQPIADLWAREEVVGPDPDNPDCILVQRLFFKSLRWKCGRCLRKGRTAIVPVDGPDPPIPTHCKCGAGPKKESKSDG